MRCCATCRRTSAAKWTFTSERGTWPLRKPGSRACFCTRSYARSHSLVTTSAGASTTRRRLQLSISSTATFIEASSGARGGTRTPKGDPPTGSYVLAGHAPQPITGTSGAAVEAVWSRGAAENPGPSSVLDSGLATPPRRHRPGVRSMAPGYPREGRTEDRPFRKLPVARDVDPLDTSAVVSLATRDGITADRANKRLLIHVIRHLF